MWQNSEKCRKTKHLVEGKRCGFQLDQAQGFFVNVQAGDALHLEGRAASLPVHGGASAL
ncbi:hypothetical protein [Paenibacillus sp. FSL W8-0194]|uniref:hypothetical protein n=1 Tax=Paenibacillus sp. FSL W8-0194 TaxID=2921711 RepID=UPI0030D7ECDF